MASILKVDDLRGNTAAGNITITSEGGSATMQLQQGLAKSWLNFNMASTTPRDSFNISSLTDRAAGKFTVNLSSAHADANYGCVGYSNSYAADGFTAGMSMGLHSNLEVTSTGSAYAIASFNGSSYVDAKYNSTATHGDLA